MERPSNDVKVAIPGVGIITIGELKRLLSRERELEKQKSRRAIVDERKMLFMLCEWLRRNYGESVYFYSPTRDCRPDVYCIKDRRCDFYELKSYYMTWYKGKLHDIPMQNIQYEHYFLKAYLDNRSKLPEDVEKYTFNYIVTLKTLDEVKSTQLPLKGHPLCASLTQELGYGLFILHPTDECMEEFKPKVFDLNKSNAEERLKFIQLYFDEIKRLNPNMAK
jgi:hypothetical protein